MQSPAFKWLAATGGGPTVARLEVADESVGARKRRATRKETTFAVSAPSMASCGGALTAACRPIARRGGCTQADPGRQRNVITRTYRRGTWSNDESPAPNSESSRGSATGWRRTRQHAPNPVHQPSGCQNPAKTRPRRTGPITNAAAPDADPVRKRHVICRRTADQGCAACKSCE